MSNKEELLDELFDSGKSAVHYLTGILKDLAEEKYSLDEVEADIEALEIMVSGLIGTLTDLRDLYQSEDRKTDKIPVIDMNVDVWSHYGKDKDGDQIKTA